DLVVIPTSALVEDGHDSIVFLQRDAEKPQFTLQRVAVARRFHDVVYLRSRLPAEQPSNTEANEHSAKPLRTGERVVSSGALVLRAALQDLQTEAKTKK